MRILLVEDDSQFADLIQTQLRRMPSFEARLETAATLAQARARLDAGRFGLVMTDLNLPDSSGLETVEALARGGEQLVIVLTGDQNPALRAAALECGAFDFLSKDNLSAAALERLVRLAALQAKSFASLRDSESRFRSLIDLSSDFYWESDFAHRVVKMEHGPARHPAANPGQLGLTRWETPAVHPDAAGWAAHRATMEAHQPFSNFEIARVDSGVLRWRSISGQPVFDEAGAFRGYRGIGRDITQQRRNEEERIAAEEALRSSEQRFRSLTALSSDWYWETDAQSRITYMSSLGPTGLDPQTYLGRARWDLLALNLSEADWARHRGQLERHEPFRDFEIERPRPEGRSVWVSLSGEPVLDEQGRLTGYRGIGRDITARKEGEQEMLRLGRLYRALGAANEAILRAKSEQEIFERACEIAVEAGGFLIGTVFRLEPGGKTLSRLASSGPVAALVQELQPSLDESLASGRGLIGHTCRTGQPAISNDYPADERTAGRRSIVHSYEVGSAAVFPLKVEGALWGVFGLQHGSRNAFTEVLTSLLLRLADNIGFAVENFERERRRRRAKRKLGESEQRFRSLTDLSSDLYWEQDAEYRFTGFSGPSVQRNRLQRAGMLGKRRWDAHYYNMTEADWAAHKALLDARQPFRELELGRVNEAGEKLWVSVSGEPFFAEDGTFKGYRGVGKDISARKRAAQLRELEHTVTRSLARADSLRDGLRGAMRAVCETEGWDCGRYFAADQAGNVMRLAEAWGVEDDRVQGFLAQSRGLTYRPGEGLSGRVWATAQPLWVTDVFKDPRSAKRLSLASGMHGAFLFPVMAEGRTIGVLGFNSRDQRQPEDALMQAIGVIGNQIGQFVQRNQAEEVLRESESRFRSLTSLSSDWYWEQDAEFRFTKFEGRTGAGYAPANAVIGKRFWDLAGLVRESLDVEGHKARLERHEAFRGLEYAYVNGAGRRFYVSVDGEPVFDAAGRFTGYRGTSRDVTEQRRGEEELRRFRAAMDMSHDAIYLTDRSAMRFVDFNQVACRSLGYTREQLLAMGPHEVLSSPRAQLEQEYDAVIAAGDAPVRVETSYSTKDGHKRWSELHRRALRSGDGWIILTISRDITERKRAEERQAAHLRYQERVARFGQAALVKAEPVELVERAVQAVLEALGADAVAYLESEAGDAGVVLRALVGVAEGAPGRVAGRPGDPIAHAMVSGTRLLADGAALPFAWARELRSAALIPVRSDEKVRGLLCACYKQPAAFGAEELNFLEAMASVLSTALQRIDSEGRLAYLAQFDPLTGLPNRTLLADRFSQMIVQAKRRDSPLAVLFIDLDGFKMVNDTLGHAGGDALLKEAAVRLQSAVRSGDTVARISGDEFAIVLADLARAEDAAIVAQKVIDRLAAAFDIHDKEVFVTASVGIAGFPGDGADADSLIGAADAAMYRAKQSGRNGFQFFTAEINQRSRARAQMGSELRRALEREEFALVYQPKYRLDDGQPHGAEALLRWKHAERGTVSPAEFIPVLEETGLIVPVGEWVLRRACQDLKAWQAAGFDSGPIAVNLSARQFRLPDLHERIKALVQAAAVDPALIELEITESQVMHDPDHAIRVLRALSDAGIRIAIDDFGTGYSSLAYLTRFPAGSLKIDRSFVKNMLRETADATIVRTIIEMAHSLGFSVVAEGVETDEQATFLRLLRCEYAQGYLFARPMPAEELVRFKRA